MKDFHFTTEEEQTEIEQILNQRKKKKTRQQMIFFCIFITIVLLIVGYCIRMVVFTELNGYVVVHNNRLRASEDIFVYDIYKHHGDFIKPGDTIYSYVTLSTFQGGSNINSESDVVIKARDLKLQYGLAYQNLEVLRARLKEIKRQIDLEDHNIRFGLSDNVHKLNLEREYKETEEELKAQQRKLYVIQNAMNESNEAVERLGEINFNGARVQNIRNKFKMAEMGFVNYAIAVDSCIVTKNWISELSLVLKGEDVIETQSFDLEKMNAYIMAYVLPSQAKTLNRGYKASIIVNDDVEYTATVVSMGARTEEIPAELRSNLSRDHIAAIAVLKIDDNQHIPFWSLVNKMPVIVRINNFDYKDAEPDEYIMQKTPKGMFIPEILREQFYSDKQ